MFLGYGTYKTVFFLANLTILLFFIAFVRVSVDVVCHSIFSGVIHENLFDTVSILTGFVKYRSSENKKFLRKLQLFLM